MGAFEYQALDEGGRTKKGVLSADTARLARDKIRELGLTPLDLKPVTDSKANVKTSKASSGGGRHKVNSTEFSVMIRQLATLLGSGLTVEDSLSGLIKQAESLSTKAVLTGIRSSILEGRSFADAIALYPRTFDNLYIASVSAGEQTGKLPEIMERLADYTETRQRLQKDISNKLAYPIFILIFSILVVILLVTYIIPKITSVYADNDQKLPLITRIIIGISDFMQSYGLILAIILVGGGILTAAYFKREGPRLWLDEQYLKLPLFKKLIRGLNTAKMSRTLSIMVGSGVPLLAAMKASAKVLSNQFMRQAMDQATIDVSEGASLNRSLEKAAVFPPMLVQMVNSGETSGKLDLMLEKAAQSTESEFEARLDTFISLFQPIMVVIMALVVVVIVLAVLMPIINLNDII